MSDPIPFKLSPDKALTTVRALAQKTANIAWGMHALDRGEERGIADLMAVEVLRNGVIRGPVEPGRNSGEWKFKIVKMIKGRREMGVVVILSQNKRIFIKTVEWEDF